MLVRLTTGRVSAGGTQQPGDVIEVSASEGNRLIELGAAEAVDQRQATRPETAETTPPRTAMRQSGRIRKATR